MIERIKTDQNMLRVLIVSGAYHCTKFYTVINLKHDTECEMHG